MSFLRSIRGRSGALSGASSTASSLLVQSLILMTLAGMDNPMAKGLLICCACSSCSGTFRMLQQMLYGFTGIRTYGV